MLRRALVVLALIPACAAAERTWVGDAGSWSSAAHWSPSGVPASGDSLVFPAVASPTTATNDLSGLSVVSLRVAPQWTLDGNTTVITGTLAFTGTGRAFGVALPLVLASAVVTVDVPTGLGAPLVGPVSGPGGLRKTGGGVLALLAVNGYDGVTTVAAGQLYLAAAGTLGATSAGTTVAAGAGLVLDQVATAEPLTLSGDGAGPYGALTGESSTDPDSGATCSGAITLAANARVVARTINDDLPPGTLHPVVAPARLTLSGAIGGPGRLTVETTGDSSVRLAGADANTYTGGTTVRRGLLGLTKTAAIAIPGALTVGGAGVLAVAAGDSGGQLAPSAVTVTNPGGLGLGGDEVIASLAGDGGVVLNDHVLQVGAGNASSTFSGAITNTISASGAAGLGRVAKNGGGTFTWATSARASRFGGGMTVEDGVMAIDASLPDIDVLALGRGTVTGNGRVGALGAGLMAAGNGTIDPGRIGAVGRLACSSLTITGTGRLVVDLAATTNDVIQVDGPVALRGGPVTPVGAGLAPNALGTTLLSTGYQIIDNDGTDAIDGTFEGWFAPAIDYSAGTGNDVRIVPKHTVKFALATSRVEESAGAISYTATINADPVIAVTVGWRVMDGTAHAGEDYAAGAGGGSITFLPGGPRSIAIPLTILDDAAPEPDESFTLALTTTTGRLALTAPSAVTVTIARNDGYVAPPPPPISSAGGGGCGSGGALAGLTAAGLMLALGLGRRR